MERAIDANELWDDLLRLGFTYFARADISRAIKEAPTIEPKQEWVSVKDRLPERGKRVLCFMKSYGKNQNDTISDNVYNGILVGSNPPKYVWEWNGDYVTHWMPLPEPPETE